jgi:hypothetical protein
MTNVVCSMPAPSEPVPSPAHLSASSNDGDQLMGRYLLGVPLPILVLIYAFGGLNH